MKIQIRRGATSAKGATVRVREKTLYHCKECGNKYYAYHLFCPQCLGEVVGTVGQKHILLITSCPPQAEEAIDSIQRLTSRTDFDFAKALRTLPWVFIMNTD